MTDGLGQFAQGVASWRKLMAAMPDDEGRWKIFTKAAYEIARYVPKGLDRITAVDQLNDIATAYALFDADEVQRIVADAFSGIGSPEVAAKANGAARPPHHTAGHVLRGTEFADLSTSSRKVWLV